MFVTVLFIVILSASVLSILIPVPDTRFTLSVLASEPVNLIDASEPEVSADTV